MNIPSKSPKRVLEEALAVGVQVFPAYSHRFSPKKFTQPQSFAGKEFLRLDHRKLTALLVDAPDLAAVIGLVQVPHCTAFQKAANRLLRSPHGKELLDAMLDRVPQRRCLVSTIDLAADAGFDAEHAHDFARQGCRVKNSIPSRIGRPTTKPPSARWRRWMVTHWPPQSAQYHIPTSKRPKVPVHDNRRGFGPELPGLPCVLAQSLLLPHFALCATVPRRYIHRQPRRRHPSPDSRAVRVNFPRWVRCELYLCPWARN